ncbi:MAG: hypothetical protein LLG00_14105 [Planctomycetaceae bacterium]|nr:hypothetical protein [Planctomycetaceae bacterium]
MIRRWSSDTRLNGQSFTDAPLAAGDRIGIGPIELDVVEVGTPSGAAEAEGNWSSPQSADESADYCSDRNERSWLARQSELEESQRKLDERQESLAIELAKLDADHGVIAADRASLENERNAWAESRRQWQTEQDEARRHIDDEHERLAAELAHIEAERREMLGKKASCESEDDAWQEKRRQWDSEQSEVQRRLDQQREQLVAETARLDAESARLADERASFETEEAAWAEQCRQRQDEQDETQRGLDQQREQLAAEAARLNAECAKLAEDRATLGCERTRWTEQLEQHQAQQKETQRRIDQQREQLTAELAKLEADRETIRDERNALTEARDSLESERRQWESEREELARSEAASRDSLLSEESDAGSTQGEVEFAPASENAPVNLADVFRRVGATVDMPEEEPEREGPRAGLVRPVSQEKKPLASPQSNGEEDEESLDAYMSRLMQRLHPTGDTESGSNGSQSPQAAWGSNSADSTTATAPIPAAQRREPASVLPRATAPEKNIDLSVLREVANLSAQNALSRHARRILVSRMNGNLFVAIAAFSAFAGLFWMSKRLPAWESTYYASLIALLVAVYWSLHYLLLTGRLIVKSGHVAWNATGSHDQAASGEQEPAQPMDEDPADLVVSEPFDDREDESDEAASGEQGLIGS